jgi:hypothetical protein
MVNLNQPRIRPNAGMNNSLYRRSTIVPRNYIIEIRFLIGNLINRQKYVVNWELDTNVTCYLRLSKQTLFTLSLFFVFFYFILFIFFIFYLMSFVLFCFDLHCLVIKINICSRPHFCSVFSSFILISAF